VGVDAWEDLFQLLKAAMSYRWICSETEEEEKEREGRSRLVFWGDC